MYLVKKKYQPNQELWRQKEVNNNFISELTKTIPKTLSVKKVISEPPVFPFRIK